MGIVSIHPKNDQKLDVVLTSVKGTFPLAELRHAALVLDRAVMPALIQRIEDHTPDTAKGLQRLVDDFQFEKIQKLFGDIT